MKNRALIVSSTSSDIELHGHCSFEESPCVDLQLASPADESPRLVGPGAVAVVAEHRRPAAVSPTLWSDSLCQNVVPRPVLPSAIAAGQLSETPTPSQEATGADRIRELAGYGFPPTDFALPTPPALKAGHNLRLPSFDRLGIAAPHPDNIAQDRTLSHGHSFSPFGAGPLSRPDDPLHLQSPSHSLLWAGQHCQNPEESAQPATRRKSSQKTIQQYVSTVTPPDESGRMPWNSVPSNRIAPLESPETDPEHQVPTPQMRQANERSATMRQAVGTGFLFNEAYDWLEDILGVILRAAEEGGRKHTSLRVLSHALPCPSPIGHVFQPIIRALQERTFQRSIQWINVFHAVPGRFNLADLPTSPPNTPGPATEGDDYFAIATYDSAVRVPDYQGDARVVPAHVGPQPVVQPSSIDLTIVERYIPPTNRSEVHGLFRTGGPSILMDRLAELSSSDGHLVFIYPTRAGGRTFMDAYLGPILDPLLRSIVIVNGLSSDLGESIGHMVSVDILPTFENMQLDLEALCRRLSRPRSGISGGELDRFQGSGRRARYTIAHAAKETVRLERRVWAEDWWLKQEKPRVREAMSRYFQRARMAADAEVTPTHLIQEVLDGVARRPYPDGEPDAPIEIGVFVVRKTVDHSTRATRGTRESGLLAPTLATVTDDEDGAGVAQDLPFSVQDSIGD